MCQSWNSQQVLRVEELNPMFEWGVDTFPIVLYTIGLYFILRLHSFLQILKYWDFLSRRLENVAVVATATLIMSI